jgi:hypothetical protein
MGDEPTEEELNPITSFLPEIRMASSGLIERYKYWGDKLNTMAKKLENTRSQAEGLANEHINLGKTLAGENFRHYQMSGPSLVNGVYFTDEEMVENLLRSRFEALQGEIAKKIKIFDDWTIVMGMFEKHFRADVEEAYGEGGAKDLS